MANFEFKAQIEDTLVILVFKPFYDMPGRISRHNVNNIEAETWAGLEWGLIEPAHWPAESQRPGSDIFDVLPQREIARCYQEWLKSDDDGYRVSGSGARSKAQ
jgi:hypothetical protein